MAEPIPRFRVVGEGETPPRKGRGPGPAVLVILLYALAFGGALWFLWAQARRRPAPAAVSPARTSSAGELDRRALAEGKGLRLEARAEYRRRLAEDRCDCGCDRTLESCLTGDQKCARSPELARELSRKLE